MGLKDLLVSVLGTMAALALLASRGPSDVGDRAHGAPKIQLELSLVLL